MTLPRDCPVPQPYPRRRLWVDHEFGPTLSEQPTQPRSVSSAPNPEVVLFGCVADVNGGPCKQGLHLSVAQAQFNLRLLSDARQRVAGRSEMVIAKHVDVQGAAHVATIGVSRPDGTGESEGEG